MNTHIQQQAETARFILQLRQKGVTNPKILGLIERHPREHFCDKAFHSLQWHDAAIPIACGQSITAPSLISRMLDLLDVFSSASVLEIGTGSAYQTTLLANMARHVHSIERYRHLANAARIRMTALRLANTNIHHGDGAEGLEAAGPFDRIIVNASVNEIPEILLKQLKPNGVIIAPITMDETQHIMRFSHEDGTMTQLDDITANRFLPLERGVAFKL